MEEFLMIILAGAVGGYIFSHIVKSENKRQHNCKNKDLWEQ